MPRKNPFDTLDSDPQGIEPVFANRSPQAVSEPKKLLQFKLPRSRVLKFHEYAAAEFGHAHGAKTRFLEKLLEDYEASLEE
jgi:hypothetical protein